MQQFIVPNAPARKVNARDGKRQFWVQPVGLIGSDGLSQRFDLWINEGETPYPPGRYVLDIERSIYVDRKGNLAIRPHLIAVAEKKAA